MTTQSSFSSSPGPLELDPGGLFAQFGDNPALLRDISNLVVAGFDDSGLGFPVRALLVGPGALSRLASSGSRGRRAVTDVIARKLREFLSSGGGPPAQASLTLADGELVVDTTVEPATLVDGCTVGASSSAVRATARVRKGSVLRVGGSIGGVAENLRASAIIGGDVDVALAVKAAVKARIGKELFGTCFTKFQNTFPLQGTSSCHCGCRPCFVHLQSS